MNPEGVQQLESSGCRRHQLFPYREQHLNAQDTQVETVDCSPPVSTLGCSVQAFQASDLCIKDVGLRPGLLSAASSRLEILSNPRFATETSP